MNGMKHLALHALICSCLLSGGAATSTGGELKYDFGPRGSRAAEGCVRIGIEEQYSRETGFGFVYGGAIKSSGSRQRGRQADARLNTFVWQSPALTFVHDLPKGGYFVSLASGDAAYEGSAAVRINGAEVVPLTQTGPGKFVTVDTHRVNVTDGKLKVEIGGHGRLNHLSIRSASGKPIVPVSTIAPPEPPGPLEPSPGDTRYYVDSSSGDDGHEGASAESAWKSLAKLDGIEFKPGDRILLKAGCRFAGGVHPKGSGAGGKPIVIDRYGEGADPVVAGGGRVENAIRLHNQHHWEIRNLTVTNTDGGDWTDKGRTIRRAVYVTAEDAGDVRHIHLKNLKIHNVRGMYRFAGHETNGGIICRVTGKAKKTRFVDLRIEGCKFHTNSIDRYPVVVTSSWKTEPACEVVWKDNTLDHTGRAHIVMPASEWPRELVYYFDPEVRKVFPLDKTAAPVSPFTGRAGCEDIFSEMAARLKRSWSFYEATRVKEGEWLFANQPGGKVHHVDEGARVKPTYPLACYGELRALGFVPPWLDADDPDLREKEDAILEQWIGQLETVGMNREADWSVRNRVFMNKTPYPAPRTGKDFLRSLSPGGVAPDLTTPEATLKYFNSLPWDRNPYSACGRIGHALNLHIAKRNQAGKEPIDAAYHQVRELVTKKYNPGKGYWAGKASPDANMKILCLYGQFGWPIPEPKTIIDFPLSRATGKAGFEGSGCSAFNQIHPLAGIFRQYPELAGYRGEEIDRYTAMTFITFLSNWNEKTNFYGNNWLGKHNNGVPLFMAHLMLDLPIMRVSTVNNWRETPLITRGKDGKITRNKVIHQTKGCPFSG